MTSEISPVSFTVTISAKNRKDLARVKRMIQNQFPVVSVIIHPRESSRNSDCEEPGQIIDAVV